MTKYCQKMGKMWQCLNTWNHFIVQCLWECSPEFCKLSEHYIVLLHIFNCHVACCNTTSRITRVWKFSSWFYDCWFFFYHILYVTRLCWFYIQDVKPGLFYNEKCLRIWMMFWSTFEMVCFVEIRVYRIGINCMQTWNDNQMKNIHNFGMDSDSTFYCKQLKF